MIPISGLVLISFMYACVGGKRAMHSLLLLHGEESHACQEDQLPMNSVKSIRSHILKIHFYTNRSSNLKKNYNNNKIKKQSKPPKQLTCSQFLLRVF